MHLRTLKEKSEINKYFNWADGMICKGLEGGAVDVIISRHDPVRNWLQNRKFHAMIADINSMGVVRIPSRTIRLNEYEAEQCKALLVIWFCNEKIQAGEKLPKSPASFECPITGQQISIRPSTTEWGKKLTCEFVEWLYAFGAHYGVTWSEKSLEQYQSYRESQS